MDKTTDQVTEILGITRNAIYKRLEKFPDWKPRYHFVNGKAKRIFSPEEIEQLKSVGWK